MLLFHAIAVLILMIALSVEGPVRIVLLVIAADFFAGVPVFVYLARRHRQGSGHVVDHLQKELLLLRKSRIMFPLVIFPGFPRSHTVIFTGKGWLRNHRFAATFARLILTDRHLAAHWRGLRTLVIQIDRADIEAVAPLPDHPEIIEVRFGERIISEATQLLAFSGSPKAQSDRVWLNLGPDAALWLEALQTGTQ